MDPFAPFLVESSLACQRFKGIIIPLKDGFKFIVVG